MAQYVIEILDGDRAGEVVPLPERALRIGRKPANDIVIADEKTSGSHAEIVPDNGRFVLRDLESTNGTTMDGRRVTEVVLTTGDIFVVGRVRMCFRGDQDAARADGSALMVQTVDKQRLGRPKGSRSMALMLVLLLGAVAVGGYLWWQRRDADGGGGGKHVVLAPLQVPGNKLPAAMATCESEDDWNLRVGGIDMQLGGRGNTGKSAIEASRSGGDIDFAVARGKQPLTVVVGRPLTLSAHVRTAGDAKAAVHLRFFASDDSMQLPHRCSTGLLQNQDFTAVQCAAMVPPGADRVEVELLAVLPKDGDSAWFDDIAVTDGGEPLTFELQHESGAKLYGGASNVAVQAGVPVLVAVEPAVTGALAGAQKEHLLTVTDLGASFAAQKLEHGFGIAAKGASALWLSFPADSGNGLLAAGDDGIFAGVAAETKFAARQVLLGAGQSRCLVALPQTVELQGQGGGGFYRLRLPVEGFELLLQFREQRSRADEMLGQARQLQQAEPGKALDLLRELLRTVPHDDRKVADARALRTDINARMEKELARLKSDFDEAGFFDTRGGFARVVHGIDALFADFGKANIDALAAVEQMRSEAAAELQKIDDANWAEHRARLEDLAAGLHQSEQPELEQLVRDYLKQH